MAQHHRYSSSLKCKYSLAIESDQLRLSLSLTLCCLPSCQDRCGWLLLSVFMSYVLHNTPHNHPRTRPHGFQLSFYYVFQSRVVIWRRRDGRFSGKGRDLDRLYGHLDWHRRNSKLVYSQWFFIRHINNYYHFDLLNKWTIIWKIMSRELLQCMRLVIII